jgi:hypothetical protein
MSTVAEIVRAAAQLDDTQFLQLRQELERLEEERWEAELSAVSAQTAKAGLTDDDIDHLIRKRRHESRP